MHPHRLWGPPEQYKIEICFPREQPLIISSGQPRPCPDVPCAQCHPAPADLLCLMKESMDQAAPREAQTGPQTDGLPPGRHGICAMIFLCWKSNRRSQPLVEEGWTKAYVPYNISKRLLQQPQPIHDLNSYIGCIHCIFYFLLNHSLCFKAYNTGRDVRRSHSWIPVGKRKKSCANWNGATSAHSWLHLWAHAPCKSRLHSSTPIPSLHLGNTENKMDIVPSQLALMLQTLTGHRLLWVFW